MTLDIVSEIPHPLAFQGRFVERMQNVGYCSDKLIFMLPVREYSFYAKSTVNNMYIHFN